jgi:hypothetical protein
MNQVSKEHPYQTFSRVHAETTALRQLQKKVTDGEVLTEEEESRLAQLRTKFQATMPAQSGTQ